MNIVHQIRTETAGFMGKTALIERDRSITYGELFAAVDSLAAQLRTMGMEPGHRVALLANDSIDYVVANLAVLSLRAVAVPISPALVETEVLAVLRTMAVHCLMVDATVRIPAEPGISAPEPIPGIAMRIARRRSDSSSPAEYARLNAAFIRFSSGTTGASKGVLLSHESILERTDAANAALRMTPADEVLWLLSMSYHFVVSILLFLRKACTVVLCEQQFPEALISCLLQRKVTFCYASPFHYHVMTAADTIARESLSSVRMAICTAVHLPPDIASAFRNKFGFTLSPAYGIIEVGLPFVNDSPSPERLTSVGKTLPDYEVKIDLPNGDGVGEILLRGKGMFDAYFSPWQLRAQVLRDGWFDTGDIGRLDSDGFLQILGRKKEVINFAGMKLFPQEVEEVLMQHPAVEECMVYGEPHPEYGQLPCVRIVEESSHAGAIDVADLRRFCYQRLASYKVPKKFEIVDRLEKTASNKLRRKPAL